MTRLFVRSLEKGFRVLGAFDESRRSLSLSEVAAVAALDKSAAQRFTYTLLSLGYLRKNPLTKRYSLAPKVLDLGFSYLSSDALVARATPHLMAANARSEETVNLTEADGLEIVYVARVPSRHAVSVDVVLGTRLPLFCTAPGRAILSHLPEGEAADLIARSCRTAFTEHTITDRAALLACLEEARAEGYAVTDQEYYRGDISVAAPVIDRTGRPVAALNIAVPSTRWSVGNCRRRLAPVVVETAADITREQAGRLPAASS